MEEAKKRSLKDMESAEKLTLMKKIGKIAKIVSIVGAIVAAVMVFLFLLMPATLLTVPGTNSKYAEGYTYYGWQMTFIGCGYPPVKLLHLFETNVAGDYVPTTRDFDFNAVSFFGVLLPILAVILCSIVSSKMRNRGKAVCEFVMAGVILIGSIMIACVGTTSVGVATNAGSGTGFLNTFLTPALNGYNGASYVTLGFPIAVLVINALISLIKVARGVFLILQRNYVRKNRQYINVAPSVAAANK